MIYMVILYMNNFTFLTDEQLFGNNQLDIISRYGTKCAIMFSFLWHILSKRKMWYKIIVPKF